MPERQSDFIRWTPYAGVILTRLGYHRNHIQIVERSEMLNLYFKRFINGKLGLLELVKHVDDYIARSDREKNMLYVIRRQRSKD